ncbi:MAG: LysM peptidoglycan-binding domain-containing protein [Candidatus Omnitrophota bacterium]
MKKMLPLIVIICVLSLNVSGCVKRFSMTTIDQERVDQEISGNKGFISGAIPPEDQPKERVTTRKVYQVTMEVPPYPEWKNFKNTMTPDKEIWGNRGYIYGGPDSVNQKQVSSAPETEQQSIVLPDENSYKVTEESEEEVSMPKPVKKQAAFSMYKVKQGDTLQKVSQNVYGSTKHWKKIYDFNQDALKNPNKIYPGQMLKIPE